MALSHKQIALYRAEWAKARKTIRAQGYGPKEADAMRYQIHDDVGAPHSSIDPAWTNAQLDLVLAHFWAWSNAGSIHHQERQLNQPKLRAFWTARNLVDMVSDFGGDNPPCDNYVRAVFARINPGEDYRAASSISWSKVIAALVKHYDRKACAAVGKKPMRHRLQYPPHKHGETVSLVRRRQMVILKQQALEAQAAGNPF